MKETAWHIEPENGKLIVGGWIVPEKNVSTEGHLSSGDYYSHINKIKILKGVSINLTVSYKNDYLSSIYLTVGNDYLNQQFKATEEENTISNFVEYSKKFNNNLVNHLTKKRNFIWGKISVQVDPRDPIVFIQIKYFGKLISNEK